MAGDVAKNECRGLDLSTLRLAIDSDEPEARPIAGEPFVVIEQRPGVVAAQVDTGGDRVVRGLQVCAEVVHPARVVDCTIVR